MFPSIIKLMQINFAISSSSLLGTLKSLPLHMCHWHLPFQLIEFLSDSEISPLFLCCVTCHLIFRMTHWNTCIAFSGRKRSFEHISPKCLFPTSSGLHNLDYLSFRIMMITIPLTAKDDENETCFLQRGNFISQYDSSMIYIYTGYHVCKPTLEVFLLCPRWL